MLRILDGVSGIILYSEINMEYNVALWKYLKKCSGRAVRTVKYFENFLKNVFDCSSNVLEGDIEYLGMYSTIGIGCRRTLWSR